TSFGHNKTPLIVSSENFYFFTVHYKGSISLSSWFNRKYDSDNARKSEKLESNKPTRQYKQIKNELTFFGESFLGFYGLEIDNTLDYRDKYFYY
ncbi:hypothetical protein GPU06_09480, partial [Streptococcus thermophilus]|nr:hypothetical protein [Streptococcus thermophilus]MCE2084677.1 hypothetical protein [Streptococcus thermophilus]